MKDYLKRKFSLTDKGAKGVIVASVYSFLQNISYMLPVFFMMYIFQNILLGKEVSLFIVLVTLVFIAVFMYYMISKNYDTTYNETYKESANLRIDIANTIKDLPLSYYFKQDLTDFSQTIMADVETIEHSLSHAIPNVYGFMGSFIIIGIFLLYGNITLGLSILLPIIASALAFMMSKTIQIKSTNMYYKQLRKQSNAFQEIIDMSLEIKAFNLQDSKEKEMSDLIDNSEKIHLKAEKGQVVPVSIAMAIPYLSLGLSIFFGVKLLITNEINLLYFAGYLFAASRLIDGYTGLVANAAELLYISSSVEKIRSLKEEEKQEGISKKFNTFDIEGKDVSFSYDNNKDIIKNIDFNALQGKVTALVGPSGCGKTTLLRLVSRLYDYNSGAINIDGSEIKKIKSEDLFKNISMVFQEVLLFEGSVLDNIRVGRYSATDDEVKEAARRAKCEEFIEKLPKGYDTLIGENGSKLSGGERQRISIARAFLKNANIILLDEISASLDVENEKFIQDSLNRLIKDKTVLIISHRMKSIQNVDQIIVMNDGEIEAFGKHDYLLENSETYRKMLESSKLSEEYIY